MPFSKDYFLSGPGRTYLITGSGLLVVLVAGLVVAYQVHHAPTALAPSPTPTPKVVSTSTSTATPLPTATPSPTATASASASATPSPTATATASASASASASATTLPAAPQATVSEFYTAYKAKKASVIAGLFTADTTTELQSLHSRLFTGVDTDGDPGGPTLFSTNSASQSASSYTILSVTQQGSAWDLSLSEQRLSGTGASAGTVQTMMVLVDQSGSWKIDSYYYAGSPVGKYDGLLDPS